MSVPKRIPTKKVFDYWRNISEHPQELRCRLLGVDREVDEFRCAPGGHVAIDHDRFTIQPGQIVRLPIKYVLAGRWMNRPWLVKLDYEAFVAAQQLSLDDVAAAVAEPEPEPDRNGAVECPECGKPCASPAGLAAHTRAKHNGDED